MMNNKRRIADAVSLTVLVLVGLGFAKPSQVAVDSTDASIKMKVENKVLHINGLKSTGNYVVLSVSGKAGGISGLLLPPGTSTIEIPLSRPDREPVYYVAELRYVASTRCEPGAGCPPVPCPDCSFSMRPGRRALP